MMKFKYKLLLGLVVLAAFSSCKKSFLEVVPPTSVSPEEAFTSEGDMLIALRGAYAGLRATDLFGRTVPVIGDVLADNAFQAASNSNRYTLYNNYGWGVSDANATGFWTTAYTAILRANNIINNTSLPSSVNVNLYKGEAHAIRALCYFYLVRYFARPYTDNPAALGVPLITVYNPDLKPARSTVAETYTLIIKDLDSAYSKIPASTTIAVPNSSQFRKYAAKGLQAKVYLTMGDNTNALTAAKDVIANGGYSVISANDYVAYWNDPGIRTSNKIETLFEVSSDAVNNAGFDALSYIYSQSGYGDFLVTDSTKGLSKLYATGDVRKGLFPAATRSQKAVTAIAKYPSIAGDRSDTKVLRMSEIYLIAAEASLPTSEPDALTYVNYITSRRGAAAIASTGAQLFEDIITERRKELALEGDRYLDLQRLKRAIDRPNDYLPNVVAIPYNNYRRILPIPQAELDANATIRTQQNPEYQ